MSAGVPARVLAARLLHELEWARLAVDAKDYDKALGAVKQCADLANQLSGAL